MHQRRQVYDQTEEFKGGWAEGVSDARQTGRFRNVLDVVGAHRSEDWVRGYMAGLHQVRAHRDNSRLPRGLSGDKRGPNIRRQPSATQRTGEPRR